MSTEPINTPQSYSEQESISECVLLNHLVLTESDCEPSVYFERFGIIVLYIQGVPGGKDLTLGECSLGQTIPI
jgi:hypothetical protein